MTGAFVSTNREEIYGKLTLHKASEFPLIKAFRQVANLHVPLTLVCGMDLVYLFWVNNYSLI